MPDHSDLPDDEASPQELADAIAGAINDNIDSAVLDAVNKLQADFTSEVKALKAELIDFKNWIDERTNKLQDGIDDLRENKT
jgi:archaellum component FlaC